jgi:hypothetical protein
MGYTGSVDCSYDAYHLHVSVRKNQVGSIHRDNSSPAQPRPAANCVGNRFSFHTAEFCILAGGTVGANLDLERK